MSRDNAQHRLNLFERSRGPLLLQLASHAALPVVLDAQLLHLLRVNYFVDPPFNLPYAAEAQLLLSSFCTEIDDGLYAIGPDERDLLLHRLMADFGVERLRDVASLLWEYSQRGTPWLAREGLTEAQQLTALNFIAPERAQAWLERAETSARGHAVTDERWFVAMRKDLLGRAEAVRKAQVQQQSAVGALPALTKLRDALTELYGNSLEVERVAGVAGVSLPAANRYATVSEQWQTLLELAWTTNSVPAVLAAVQKDHGANRVFQDALQKYWILLAPALTVIDGHFGEPSPEWKILDKHRETIERSIRSVCLFILKPTNVRYGLGFLIGERRLLTHRSTTDLPTGKTRSIQAALAFANYHNSIPKIFEDRPAIENFATVGDIINITITSIATDESTGACAVEFLPDRSAELPSPLALTTDPPTDLVGRKVYVLGYPLQDPRKTLRLQPGEIQGTDKSGQIVHNCYAFDSNVGSPLIDVETGSVLGLHYADQYQLDSNGLKKGLAIPIWQLVNRPIMTQAVKGEATTPPAAFMSYTGQDHTYFGGAFDSLRKLLELGVQVVSGDRDFKVVAPSDGDYADNLSKQFQQIVERTAIFIPILTPIFFTSDTCRRELQTFLSIEKARGRSDLILPIYYVTTPLLEDPALNANDPLATQINNRQRYDWRPMANLPMDAPQLRRAVHDLAAQIRRTLARTPPSLKSVSIPEPVLQTYKKICQIRTVDTLLGHGFLVASDLVLTCFSVVSSYLDKDSSPSFLCRFDVTEGLLNVEARLVVYSPTSIDGATTPHQLNLALLQLHVPVGNHRGWLDVFASTQRPPVGNSIYLISFRGKDVELRAGVVAGLDKPGTRLFYSVERASEGTLVTVGAPCVDAEGRLIGMQESVSGEIGSRRGQVILSEAIANDLGQRGLRLLGPSLNEAEVGDMAFERGNLTLALRSFEAALSEARRLAEADPNNVPRQRELAVLYNKVGDVQLAQSRIKLDGTYGEARSSFSQALAIIERIANADPGNWELQRDLANSYERLAGVLVVEDRGQAWHLLEGALSMRQGLSDREPERVDLKQDLASCLELFGSAYLYYREHEPALKILKQAVAIRERLAGSAPLAASFQRGLSTTLAKLAEVYWRMGHVGQAQTLFEHCLSIREALARGHPNDIRYQDELAEICDQLGHLAIDLGDQSRAIALYHRSIEIREKLANEHPQNAVRQVELLSSFEAMSEHEPANARAHLHKALSLAEGLTSSPGLETFGSQSAERIAKQLAKLGRTIEADITQVFISCSPRDTVIAKELQDQLTILAQKGRGTSYLTVFIDTESIAVGQMWEPILREALKKADMLIVIFTGDPSFYLGFELGMFSVLNKQQDENKSVVCVHNVDKKRLPLVLQGYDTVKIAPDGLFRPSRPMRDSPIGRLLKNLCQAKELYTPEHPAAPTEFAFDISQAARHISSAFELVGQREIATANKPMEQASAGSKRTKKAAAQKKSRSSKRTTTKKEPRSKTS
jgi:tetratricopeptide (TPR) repeat protein